MMIRPRTHLLCALAFGLAVTGCSDAEAGYDGAGSSRAKGTPIPEPDAAALLIAPPPGAEFQARASESENEDGSAGPRRYGSSGGFRAVETRTYVYLTDEPLEEVGRFYVDAADSSIHSVDLEDMIADWNTGDLDVAESAAADMPPDEMEAMFRQLHQQGQIDKEDLDEALSGLERYRKIYPKIKDVTVRSLELEVQEESEGRDEYLTVDLELSRPYVDPADLDVKDRTAIIYTIHRMKREDS